MNISEFERLVVTGVLPLGETAGGVDEQPHRSSWLMILGRLSEGSSDAKLSA